MIILIGKKGSGKSASYISSITRMSYNSMLEEYIYLYTTAKKYPNLSKSGLDDFADRFTSFAEHFGININVEDILLKKVSKEEVLEILGKLADLFDPTLGVITIQYEKKDFLGKTIVKIPIIEVGGELLEMDNIDEILNKIKESVKIKSIVIYLDPETVLYGSKNDYVRIRKAIDILKGSRRDVKLVYLLSKFDKEEGGYIWYLPMLQPSKEKLEPDELLLYNRLYEEIIEKYPESIAIEEFTSRLKTLVKKINGTLKKIGVEGYIEVASSEEVDKYLFIDKVVWYIV